MSDSLIYFAIAYQIISNIGDQLGVMTPLGQVFRRVWSNQAQPEPRVVHTQLVVEIKVLPVIEKYDVKVVRRLGFGSFRSDQKVTLQTMSCQKSPVHQERFVTYMMRVSVEEAVDVNHLREYPR